MAKKELPMFKVIVTFSDGSINERKARGIKAAKSEYKHAMSSAMRFGGAWVSLKDAAGNDVRL